MQWILPPAASSYAGDIDFLYYLILVITGIAFVVVEVGLLWFVIRYRARPGRRATYTHGNMRAEVVWTAIPAVTVVALGIMSGGVWDRIKGRDSVPADALPYRVTARQFEWHVTHPGPDGMLDTPDDFTLRNQLHVPVDRPVVVHLGSEDVIHSFFVPAFRIKQDAVPGMHIRVWFEATDVGAYELACAELCGLGHYRMGAMVTVHESREFEEWTIGQAALRSPAAQGVTP
jgi:cytochrome c oxidase subunit 2